MAESDGAGKGGRDPGSRTFPSNLSSRSHGIGFDNINLHGTGDSSFHNMHYRDHVSTVSPFVTSLPACFITIFYL